MQQPQIWMVIRSTFEIGHLEGDELADAAAGSVGGGEHE